MNIHNFNRFVKTFYVCAALYIYIFIMLDIFRLNPEDDGDVRFFASLLLIVFAVFAVMSYRIFSDEDKRYRKIKRIILVFGQGLFLFIIMSFGQTDSPSELITRSLFILWVLMPAIPLLAYLLYKKLNGSKIFFALSVITMCMAAFTTYPAKNYIQAMNGDPCATNGLIIRQGSGRASSFQEVHGNVVCIAADRGYPSETFQWKVFDIADAKTFEYLGDGYGRDKEHVYYEGAPIDANPKSFTMDPGWKTDETQNFIQGGTQYKKDGHNIYFKGEKVSTVNIDQFRIIDICDSYRCATDGSAVFMDGEVVKQVNVGRLTSFHACEYAKDDIYVYHAGEIIDSADVNTFNVYGPSRYCYAYDRAHVYYEGVLVSDAPPSKLQKINESDPFSPYTDGTNIYFDGKKLDLDMNNFKYLGKSVVKDGQSVYYRDKKIEGADPATFELGSIDGLNMCAKDKNKRYFDGEVYDHPMCKW